MDTTKTIDITKRELTVSADVANRVYNGLTTVTVSNETITGWATPDTALDKTYANVISGTLTGTVASKDVGTVKAVTFSGCNPKICNHNL